MSRTKRPHPPAADLRGDSVQDAPHKGIWVRQDNHFGNQRRMRAKAKVDIRRRDRKRLGKPDEESGVIEPREQRSRLTCIK
jgi:hypothetical protein